MEEARIGKDTSLETWNHQAQIYSEVVTSEMRYENIFDVFNHSICGQTPDRV